MKIGVYKKCVVLFIASSFVSTQALYKDYLEIPCVLEAVERHPQEGSHPFIPAPEAIQTKAPKGQVGSTNWAGYVAATHLTNPATNSVSRVAGSWIVPTVVPTKTDTYSALWIGIDGYKSSTVEQIGTSHDSVNGKQSNYAWFEMYPGPSYKITNFPLHPGNVISANIVYSDNGVFTMSLHNSTLKVSVTIPVSYTTSLTALRNSAEWIVEAPFLQKILPLANFKTAHMRNCLATMNGVTGPIQHNSWQNFSIKMITNTGAAKATTSPLLSDHGSFMVTWLHQ